MSRQFRFDQLRADSQWLCFQPQMQQHGERHDHGARDEDLMQPALERALDVHAADKQAKDAQAAVDNEAALRTRLEAASGERAGMSGASPEASLSPEPPVE